MNELGEKVAAKPGSTKRIRQAVENMSDYERADIALGFIYVVDNGVGTEIIPAEIMDSWYYEHYTWFGHEDVALHEALPSNYSELSTSGLTASKLSSLVLQALEYFESHIEDPLYLHSREIQPR